MNCWCDYEMPDVSRSARRTARKAYTCDECFSPILPGDQYENAWGVWEGESQTYRTCIRCLALRDWVQAHVPCFCWAYGNVIEDAIVTAEYYAHEAPGLLFGALRRQVLIARTVNTPAPHPEL